MLHGDFFGSSIVVDAARHPAMAELGEEFHGALAMALHGLTTPPFWLALAGVVVAWWFYLKQPAIPAAIQRRFMPVYKLLEQKYYMDWINEHVFAVAARSFGRGLWKIGDEGLIDGVVINGSARMVGGFAVIMRRLQTGYLYWYALTMTLGVFALMTWQLWPSIMTALRNLMTQRGA
jgi:NADH-quinone oxidoreductase subunit L